MVDRWNNEINYVGEEALLIDANDLRAFATEAKVQVENFVEVVFPPRNLGTAIFVPLRINDVIFP